MVILEKLSRNKLCVDLIGPTTHSKYRPKFNILLETFSLNPPSQRVDIIHNEVMMIANLVDIFYMTAYNHL